ncbi:nicotinate phosphoribosyltransferase [Desertimonas flava]|uniref:nicotinate phosphoribosyltransferase n=1 Tax=Desertimonas flava TaxID=2064846 RepID=UPI000E3448CA|nr:nicotinate phosphoribosyltransferase [Desertimonas flava]
MSTVSHPVLRGGVLSTDAYQLTMAQLYLRAGVHDRTVRFEHFFRSYPDYGTHQAGYCIAAGLAPFAEWMVSTRATASDVDALRRHRGRAGTRLFDDAFCDWFASVDFHALRLEAVAEGRVVHPNTPISTIEGPLGVAQLIETPLLNQLNFATLIATKSARVAEASLGRPVLEFGMRRAAGTGADAASRAAIVGGAVGTSNAAVAYELGRDPVGTHAHSLVQFFIAAGGTERDAFEHYADTYPDDCLLLVDTLDTLESGVPNAIAVFEDLRRRGHRPVGIRLDSGDLAYLAVQSARQLDAAGFPDSQIVLSSQLDEITIWQIVDQIAAEARRAGVDADHVIDRLAFGVGSRLATSDGDPMLDGVYKLVAVRGDDGRTWRPAIKRSDSPAKVLNPGRKRLWRLYDEHGTATADVLASIDETLAPGSDITLHHHALPNVSRVLRADRWSRAEELTATVVESGVAIGGLDDLDAAAARRRRDVDALDPGVRRLVNPHEYHVSITTAIHDEKQTLLERLA